MLLNSGTQSTLIKESTSQPGTTSRDVGIETDAILLALVVTSITGTLDINVYSVADGQKSLLLSFPQVTAATTSVLLRRSAITTSSVHIEATYSGQCSYTLQARAVGAGASDTKILGAGGWKVSQQTLGTTAALLVPVAFNDRAGVLIRNWSVTQTIYVAESSASADPGIGYPLAPKETIAIDIAAGAEVWGESDAAGADVRIVEAGG